MDFTAYLGRKLEYIRKKAFPSISVDAFTEEHIKQLADVYLKKPVFCLDDELLFTNHQKITVFPHFAVFPHSPVCTNVGMHSHAFYEFAYVYKGSCTTNIDDVSLTLHEGDLLLMNLQATHDLTLHNPGTMIFNILVKPSVMDNTLKDLVLSNDFLSSFFIRTMRYQKLRDNYVLFPGNDDGGQKILLEQLIEEDLNTDVFHETAQLSLLCLLLIVLTRSYRRNLNTQSMEELGTRNISDIVQYIADHCKDVSISSLAVHFNYSPNYLSAMIKKYSGSSFSDILQSIRFRKAALLLRDTLMSVADIAESVGCTNRTWFTQKFKERYSVSPSEYRKDPVRSLARRSMIWDKY